MLQAEHSQLFYFNGFNSGIPANLADNPKIAEVADMAERWGMAFHPVTVDYRHADAHRNAILERVSNEAEYVLFWGSSMGGWFARIMQVSLAEVRPGLQIEAAAYNPAFDLVEHSHLLIGPQEKKLTQEAYEWTTENSADLVHIENSVNYDAELPYTVYVDRDDEVIDAVLSETRHRSMARFVAYEGGSHSFEHYREAVQDFENGLRRVRRAVIE